jgi:hypothetical protein
MIVNNLNKICVPVSPFETDSPLVANANAMLTFSVGAEVLQFVSRWRLQVTETGGSINHSQLSLSHPLTLLKFLCTLPSV